MKETSERTRREMEAGRRAIQKVGREAYVERLQKRYPNRIRVATVESETIVRVSADGQGWSVEDVLLREPTSEFPSAAMQAKLILVLG